MLTEPSVVIGMPSSAELRVLLALVHVVERDGRATVRTVADAAGLASKATAHRHLRGLRALGLVTWTPRTLGTLRPLVRRVTA